MIQDDYQIQVLAEKVRDRVWHKLDIDTIIRRIRYYQEKKLLPKPEIREKIAYYNDDYLLRLEMIEELKKKKYLPLSEIAKQLEVLNPLQMKNILEGHKVHKFSQLSSRDVSTNEPIEPGPKAINEYIRTVHRSQPEAGELKFDKDQPALFKMEKSERYMAGTPTESWRRILLSNWLDIQAKEPLSPENEKLLEELIKFAKNLIR